MPETVNLTIDGHPIAVKRGTKILEAIRTLGIEIPTLCHHPRLNPVGSCRVCVVEVEGSRVLVPSCARDVEEGMVVRTDTPKAVRSRRMVIELLLADHPTPCEAAFKPDGCELERYALQYGVKESRLPRTANLLPVDDSNRGITFNPNSCILCHRCIRACGDLQSNEVIGLVHRGFETKISFDFDEPMGKSTCVSCGECVAVCPTGALMDKTVLGLDAASKPKTVDSVCPYCGVGCTVTYHVVENRIVKALGNPLGPANKGRLCVKGKYGWDYIHHSERLTRPLIRREGIPRGRLDLPNKLDAFREATWEEALSLVARRLMEIKDKYGSDALCGLACAKAPNEDNYVFQKFVRAVLGTNNVDYCTRLCHSSSVYALVKSLGDGASTNSIGDIPDAEVIVVIGSNTTENHPVIATFIKDAAKRGTKLIVIDTRRIELCRHAYLHLQHNPGTDIALLNGLAWVIVHEGLVNKAFIENRTVGFEELLKAIEPYTPEMVEKITGVPKEKIIEAARVYAKARSSAIYWGMGISQHTTGSDNSFALINLALITGQVGKPGTGLNPLRGQNNVQGASDVGCLPFAYPGYQPVEDEAVRRRFENFWGVRLSPKAGLTVTEMMKAALEGRLKAIYIMGENPAISDPDINKVEKCLESFEFMVVQDIFLTETAEYADVVLPAAAILEREGTVVNTDRRVQLSRKVVDPPGEARPDWEIICDVASRMGYPMRYSSAAEIAEEIAAVTPIMAGITHDRIQEVGVQWPCPSRDHPGTSVLHVERFNTPDGRAVIKPVRFAPEKELPDESFPYVLNTGRLLEHWHTGTMTRRSKVLDETAPRCIVEMSPEDLRREGIKDGELVRVVSRRGELVSPVKASRRVKPGAVFIPFHFREAAANLLTIDAVDPYAKIPAFKFCAVRVERLT